MPHIAVKNGVGEIVGTEYVEPTCTYPHREGREHGPVTYQGRLVCGGLLRDLLAANDAGDMHYAVGGEQ